MIIDCHAHLEERLLTIDQMLKKMDACGIDKTALMAPMVDSIPEAGPLLIRLFLFLLTHQPLRPVARLLAARFTDDGAIKLPAGTFPVYPDPDNTLVFDAVDKHPDRFFGWIFVNPRGKKDPVKEYDRWKDHPGTIGVKAHPFWHRYPPAELAPVARRAVADGRPLLIHAGFGEHGRFEELVAQVPGLKLILAHAGFPEYGETWPKIADNTNILVDVSQTSYVGEKILAQVVRALGVERCCYGTDGPFGFHDEHHTFDMCRIKKRIEKLLPDAHDRQKILGDNFAAFANLQG
jgi:predicted TIM-barrel fold metal-dependent hydrolase